MVSAKPTISSTIFFTILEIFDLDFDRESNL